MMGIGFPELMIILVIIMIIFGAGKLPEIGSAFGRSIKNFKTSMKEAQEEEDATASVEGGSQEAIDEESAESQSDENLTDEEKEDLIEFLLALSGGEIIHDPPKLPAYEVIEPQARGTTDAK